MPASFGILSVLYHGMDAMSIRFWFPVSTNGSVVAA